MLANKDEFVMAEGATKRVWLLLAVGLSTLLCSVCEASRTICVPQPIRHNVTALGGVEAGDFRNLGTTKDMSECLRRACDTKAGNIAFLLDKRCFSLHCNKRHSCDLETEENSGIKTAGALYRIIAAYPKFAPLRHVEVSEGTRSLKEVFRFEATAESRTKKKETMSYKIVRGNIDKTFRVYPEMSNWGSTVRLLKALDRENIANYGLQIRATNTKENVSSLLNISIRVLDDNDNPPEFMTSPFVFSIFSNVSVGSLIGRLVARDNDTAANSKLEYAIKDQSELITYNKATGEIRLGQKRRVDSVEEYTYDITVTDGLYTTKGRLKVVLYPNNINRPIFEKTSFEVRLNGQVPLDTEVLQVSATDPDYGKLGELTYVILDGDNDGVFMITSEGVIRTTRKIPLDRELYNLTIGAHDNGYPELHASKPAIVVVLVQWLRFKQDIYEVRVQEDFSLLEIVFAASASRWDGGIEIMAGHKKRAVDGINYYLEGDLGTFWMEESSGVITLSKALDYETHKVYTMTLRADYESADSTASTTVLSAKAILRVEILDVNDNHPKFSELYYTQDVWKSSTVNSPVLRINATDIDEGLNGLVHYEVVSGNFNKTFLFEDDGMVFLKKSLLQNQQSTFNITVAAWDSGKPEPLRSERTACVIINVRGYVPKSPKFTRDSYDLLISEGVQSGVRIYQVNATVPDKQWKITYWFRNLNAKMPFRVDPRTGWIYTTKRLDREENDVYVLAYIASAEKDRTSLTTMVNVTITLGDENDNRPTFHHPYYSTVVTSQELGMSLLTVQATDKDEGENGRIVYSLAKGENRHFFSIDSRSGEITTRRSLPPISLLALKVYVSAKDQGNPSLSSLKPVPVYVLIGSTFPITVKMLGRTATTITLRFTLVNATLADVSHIGIVVQEADRIYDYDEITKRDLVSWHYVNTAGNDAYAQRYLTGNVTCTHKMRKKKSFDYTVGSDGDQCTKNKQEFCNGKLQAEKKYRLQLVAYFKNGTSPKNATSVESLITSEHETGATTAKRMAGFRSWHYDVIVIVLGVVVGIVILATIIRAFVMYRRDKFRMKNGETKGSISYPMSNPRYRRSGDPTPRSSRSTMSFTELSKSRKLDKKEKMSPCDTEKLPMTEQEGVSPDSGCGVSVKSSNSDIHHRGRSSVRRALFSFGITKQDEEQPEEPEEDGSDKEMETELNT